MFIVELFYWSLILTIYKDFFVTVGPNFICMWRKNQVDAFVFSKDLSGLYEKLTFEQPIISISAQDYMHVVLSTKVVVIPPSNFTETKLFNNRKEALQYIEFKIPEQNFVCINTILTL